MHNKAELKLIGNAIRYNVKFWTVEFDIDM